MEDDHFVEYPYGVDIYSGIFCVFDGHVGAGAANAARDTFPKVFKEQVKACGPINDYTRVFIDTYSIVDSQMLEYEYEGTTCTTVYIWQLPDGTRYLQSADVGDSSAFLCRGNISINLTETHKVSEENEKIRMREAGFEVGNAQTRVAGLAVSRALGDHFAKQNHTGLVGIPYVSEPIRLTSEDKFLVVASDGLWDVITGQRAVDILLQQPPEESADNLAEILLHTAIHSSKCTDNVTVIVVKL